MSKRITRETAEAIRAELERHEYRAGEFRENLAAKYNATRSIVDQIASGKNWAPRGEGR